MRKAFLEVPSRSGHGLNEGPSEPGGAALSWNMPGDRAVNPTRTGDRHAGIHHIRPVRREGRGRGLRGDRLPDRRVGPGAPAKTDAKKADAKKEEKAKEPEKPKEEEKPASKHSREDVRAKLKEYAALEGKDAAIKILKDNGAASITELEEDKFDAVMEACGD
ncbi:hypothetical protein ELZ23_15660 [Brucella abortus]|nr:hypothetical protein [Brucella abortus]RUQ67363.1 hypothetical protein ELZ23_15660 [Brucella abortus]